MPGEKKATPKAAIQTQHHHNNLDKPYKPKSQRERRYCLSRAHRALAQTILTGG